MSDLMTVDEVAAYFRHPNPASTAASLFVSRLVSQGLPCIAGMRPRRFLRVHVEAFARGLAEAPTLARPAPAGGRRRSTCAPKGAAPIAALLERLKASS
jgi:hypothetical protein